MEDEDLEIDLDVLVLIVLIDFLVVEVWVMRVEEVLVGGSITMTVPIVRVITTVVWDA